uniref:Uncharacterized protein n=1 Tax=Ralstonia solanacearum TaxID=305 RepID=A0A0S4WXW1_RALSL|nr:protein of unknown function [Ralstonia solanacearum]
MVAKVRIADVSNRRKQIDRRDIDRLKLFAPRR